MPKSLWQSFENKKFELTVFYYFPCFPLWCLSFLLQPPVCGCIFCCKIAHIQFFQQIENLSKRFAKISVTKFWKWKIWVYCFLVYSMLSVVVSLFLTTASYMCLPFWVLFIVLFFFFYHSLLYVSSFFGVKWPIFSFSNKLKISQNVLQKSRWQSFKNEKYELTVF